MTFIESALGTLVILAGFALFAGTIVLAHWATNEPRKRWWALTLVVFAIWMLLSGLVYALSAS